MGKSIYTEEELEEQESEDVVEEKTPLMPKEMVELLNLMTAKCTFC